MRPTSKLPPFPPFLQDLRVRYYNLLVTLHQARHDPLALFKDFTAVLATRGLADDAAQLSSVLSSVVLYLCLSPWDNEVSDAMHRLVGDKRLDPLPSHRALLKLFTTQELVPWPLPPALEVAVRAHPAFLLHPATGASASSPEEVDAVSDSVVSGVHGATASATRAAVRSTVVRLDDETRVGWWAILRKRVMQHNLRVVATWYDRVGVDALAALLGTEPATVEMVLAELVSSKSLWGRIDRPAGVVNFVPPITPAQVLAGWGGDVDTVLSLAERALHLIGKERVVAATAAAVRS